MTKGIQSHGKKSKKKPHVQCKRCGKASYHSKKKVCAACGYGKSKKKNSPKKE
ncbi:MAG: 50S ribosomal protein L37e [Candidatus Altiarchaeota archaeon]